MKFTVYSSSFRTVSFGGLTLLSLGLLPMVAQAGALEISDQAPANAVTEFSAEGKQLLAITLLLALALVGMERFCSWRLDVNRRRDSDAPPSLPECLPPLSSGPSALFSSSPEAQRR